MVSKKTKDLSNELDEWFYGPSEKRSERCAYSNDSSSIVAAVVSNKSGSVILNDFRKFSYFKRPRKCDTLIETNAKYSLFEESLGCFSVFKRQRDALKRMVEEGSNARIFSFEHPSCHNGGHYVIGGRRFLVTTVERFWQWYKCKENVSFYELIPDKIPVRLFFDLEFYREFNMALEPKTVIAEFNRALINVIKRIYDIDLDVNKDMLILDASTSTKFSEHIIVHLPEFRLFPSCVSIRKLTKHLEGEMHDLCQGLVYNTDGTKKVTVFDNAVYTLYACRAELINRNFRLYRSSKLRKNNPLHLASRCLFYKMRNVSPSSKQIFLDSLIVPVNLSGAELLFKEINGEEKLVTIYRSLPNVLQIQPEPSVKEDYLEYMKGYGETSPFPVLEFHILQINKRWRPSVTIRSWKISKHLITGRRFITYYLAGCRFCFNIGREHRSNGVFWTVDLDNAFCYQKCFDIDCRGTSSNYFPLPSFVKASITLKNGEHSFNHFMLVPAVEER
uniref:DNA-directed primase/polymerase protein n=1 Tax=Syphacia muris TaxID=451379 RepID=A0A0N5AMC0_9BILA